MTPIKLTDTTGTPVYVNLNSISRIGRFDAAATFIGFADGFQILVLEYVDDILEMIEAVKQSEIDRWHLEMTSPEMHE